MLSASGSTPIEVLTYAGLQLGRGTLKLGRGEHILSICDLIGIQGYVQYILRLQRR